MDPCVGATHTKRFVVEDSITRVTSDGEPHGMMTMIAGLSGLLAAVVILAILVALVGCKKNKRTKQCKNCGLTVSADKLPSNVGRSDRLDDESKRSSVSTTYTRATSLEEGVGGGDFTPPARQPTVAIIYEGNLKGNLNSAFVGNELNLSGSCQKKKKKAHWSDEVTMQPAGIKETTVDMEKY